MRALLQRVTRAKVSVGDRTVGEIGRGLLIFLGVAQGDTEQDLDILVKKISALRIFTDDAGKMNLSVRDVKGAVLVVSQFTLCADTTQGNRPSFMKAAAPAVAIPLYEQMLVLFRVMGLKVSSGEFGADMQVDITNDGPVTILLDTRDA